MDDVALMAELASVETFLVLVDSSRRDLALYPDSSEYVAEFDVPFCNVVGLDLMDVCMPLIPVPSDTPETFGRIGGHAIRHRRMASSAPDVTGEREAVGMLTRAMHSAGLTVSALANSSGRLCLVSDAPFHLDAVGPSGRRLGFEAGMFSEPREVEVVSDAVECAEDPDAFSLVRPGETLTQRLVARSTGRLHRLRIATTTPGAFVHVDLVDRGTGAAFHMEGQLPEIEAPPGIPLREGESYELRLSVPSSGDGPAGVGTRASVWTDGGMAISGVQRPSRLCVRATTRVGGHALEARCIPDLASPLYVVVRCAEIDPFLNHGRAGDSARWPGLGLVKLLDSQFDAYPPRRFLQPLGSVSRLTFRIERPDGTLQDAGGRDHALLLAVRCLVARASPTAMPRVLNPSYRTDAARYVADAADAARRVSPRGYVHR